MKNKKNIMMKVVRNSITKIAEKKAYSNCIGFMYEPKKPEKYSKPYKKKSLVPTCKLTLKKMRTKKIICSLLTSVMVVCGLNVGNVYATEIDQGHVDTKENISGYETKIEQSDLSEDDKEWLMNNDMYKQEYLKLTLEGWELQNVEIENVEQAKSADRSERSTTVNTTEGKVVVTDYIQPTKSQTKYNNKIYSDIQGLKKYVSFGSSIIPTKVAWVATTLFSLDTSKYAVFFNNGYQKMEENATYHIKSAYYKEGKNYWLGYRASKMDVAGVISYFYRDSNKTPYADAYDYKNSYKSLNYTTSSDRLVALAKKYYKSGAVDEDITYGSTFYLN